MPYKNAATRIENFSSLAHLHNSKLIHLFNFMNGIRLMNTIGSVSIV